MEGVINFEGMEQNEIKSLLLRSLTEALDPEETAALQAALRDSEALRLEQEHLLLTRQLVQQAVPPPDPHFAGRVLRKLANGRKEVALVVRLFPRVAAACVAVLLALSLFLYFEGGGLSSDVLMGLQDLSVDEAVALTEY